MSKRIILIQMASKRKVDIAEYDLMATLGTGRAKRARVLRESQTSQV